MWKRRTFFNSWNVLLKSFQGFETIVGFLKLYSVNSRAFETGGERRLCTIEVDTVFFMQHFSFGFCSSETEIHRLFYRNSDKFHANVLLDPT
jgi:hypothetical protein